MPIPKNIQDKIKAVLAMHGEVGGDKFPALYAARWGRPLDYGKLGYAKLTAAMRDVRGVADIPCRSPPGPNSFVLLAAPAKGRSHGQGQGKGKAMVPYGGKKPAAKKPEAGGVAFGAYKVNADGSKVGLHIELKAPQRLVFSVAVDCSWSMQGERIRAACAGVQEIVQGVVRDDDLYACAGFHTDVEQLHAPMPKKRVNLATDLTRLAAVCAKGGLTALHDATRTGIEGLKAAAQDSRTARAVGGAQALKELVFYQVVITDGGDNSSSTTLEQLKALVARPGLRNYHLIVIGVGVDASLRRTLEEICAPTHATFQPAADCAALRAQMRWARDRIQATLTTVDRRGRVVGKTVATGSGAVQQLAGSAAAALGGAFGAMKLVAAAPAAPPKQRKQLKPKAGGGGGGSAAYCSSCGKRKQSHKFCGHCGASSGGAPAKPTTSTASSLFHSLSRSLFGVRGG